MGYTIDIFIKKRLRAESNHVPKGFDQVLSH